MCDTISWDFPGIDKELVKYHLMELFQIGEIAAGLKDIRWFLTLTKEEIIELQDMLNNNTTKK